MNSSKIRVLVVDDEAGFTQLLRLNLESRGEFSVREVGDPMLAISVAREFEPHVVLLDIVMPGLDGVELASQFREDSVLKDTPVIFLTALGDSETAGENGSCDGDGNCFLRKPVALASLIGSIHRCIQERGRPRAS